MLTIEWLQEHVFSKLEQICEGDAKFCLLSKSHNRPLDVNNAFYTIDGWKNFKRV